MEKIYASPEFYLNKIQEAIQFLQANDIQGIGNSVFSFFSGEEYINGQQATVDSYHFEVLFKNSALSGWCQNNPIFILKWIEAIFFYFRSMSAIPEIAQSIWPWAARIVEIYRNYEIAALLASCQLASWDFFYGREHHPEYLQHIKSLHLKSKEAKLYRSLFNTTTINKDQPDYIESVKYAYRNRRGLSEANLAIAIINYYCHVNCQDEVLEELKSFLTGRQMRNAISIGNCDFLKPLLFHFYEKNDYNSLLFLLRKLKGNNSTEIPQSSHGFLLSNGERLSVLSTSGKDVFENTESYESYKKLIRVSNRSTNTAISLLGEFGEDTGYFDEARRGTPSVEDDLEDLADAVIEHFRLHDSLYSELHSITLTPSHSFPIQSALFRLGKNAPIISTSLEEIVDDPELKRFIFFLSSHTSTCNIEHEFIIREFGPNENIIIDPSPELFAQTLESDQYNVVYISAHGEYDHWNEGSTDEIYFSKESRVTAQTLKNCIPPINCKRNIILNICDGATTKISCNPYSRGISAAIAKGNQTVISHLWPVSTVYACAFGMLALYFIKSHTAIASAKLTFETLNKDTNSITSSAASLSPSFSILRDYLAGKNFNMRAFKNIGSIAVYS